MICYTSIIGANIEITGIVTVYIIIYNSPIIKYRPQSLKGMSRKRCLELKELKCERETKIIL